MSDTSFSSDWLDLREPAAHAARDRHLLKQAAECVGDGSVVLDLGSGTGSTTRAFKGLLPEVTWRFVDGDQDLLDIAVDRHAGSEQVVADLRDVDAIPLDGVSLVTASALLDLMPESWIEALAHRLEAERVPLYAALNYDGEMAWTPALSEDESITASFNEHQRTDKGIGLAAGPGAAQSTRRIFAQLGFDVRSANSPWKLDVDHRELQGQLLAGIAAAASEVGNAAATGWLAARRKALDHSSGLVGHADILAVPT